MKKRHLLPALALAVLGLLSAGMAQAATREPARASIHKPNKQAPRVKSPHPPHKPAKKLAKKPPPKSAAPVAAAKASTDTETRIAKPGDYRFAIQHDGRARTYRVHVPAAYDSNEPAPLVVALHGSGIDQHGNDGLYSLVRESDRQGFIAVFPDAYRGPGEATTAAWNTGACCSDARDQRVNDVGFIETVVANVFRQVSIARLHIYAAGMSDGGTMAYRLACERPYLFRAVASVGGTDNTLDCTPAVPVSVLHIHARNDPRVPFAGVPDGGTDGKALAFTSAEQTAAKWAKLDGCMETPRPILDKAGASCRAYSYCRGQAEVQLCATDTGGHSWPGASRQGSGAAPSQAISATQAISTFFSSR